MIIVNNDKAIELTKNRIRTWRESEFSKNDINIQNAMVDGTDLTLFIERRNYLRDLPSVCEGKTLEQLKEILEGLV